MTSARVPEPAPRPASRTFDSPIGRSLEAIVVLVKVAVFCIAWLVVFLLTFLGYLTLPAIVLFGFLVLYGVTDFVGRKLRRAGPK